ncbi:hypothetical protein RF11_15786 [Thelohanellus kitauei]|uniref:Uncharacterized protein n=1 Tax=Thelohanellus kitauei TaxID=669202 RepID=A0A0C2IKM3_THEKT|nr:hypothetical protein RF11_15786 [Thelohanellus kitauei]
MSRRGSDYWRRRRMDRDEIIERGVKKAWGKIPKKPITTIENFEKQEYLTKIHDPSLNAKAKTALNEKLLKGIKNDKEAEEPHDEDWVESTAAELMIGPQPLLGDPMQLNFGKPLEVVSTEVNSNIELSEGAKSGKPPEIKAETTGTRDSHRHYFDEKRATLLEKQESRARRENKILSDFRELIHKKSMEKKKI